MNPISDKSKITTGICTISYNEEQDLPYFLEHLLPWVDEIVIVDDGSTDKTSEIAHSYGEKVKFFVSPRNKEEGYDTQRNKAIAIAKSEWLLHMDVDERVTPDLVIEIMKAIQDPNKDGYKYRRLNFFVHHQMRAGGWQNWNRVQLARRTKSQFVGKIHEKLVIDCSEDRIGQLEGMMWHLADESYEERLKKNISYSKLEAEKICHTGKKVRWYHLIFRPFARMFKSFVLERGFIHGELGVIFALYTFTSTFNWYAFAWFKQNNIEREDIETKIKEKWQKAEVKSNGR